MGNIIPLSDKKTILVNSTNPVFKFIKIQIKRLSTNFDTPISKNSPKWTWQGSTSELWKHFTLLNKQLFGKNQRIVQHRRINGTSLGNKSDAV